MSAPGGPGAPLKISKPTPPERGSFPLDHDAECQHHMKSYLRCIRSAKGVNSDNCRRLSQAYLQCRMENNLMAVDSMRNLGFSDLEGRGGVVVGKAMVVGGAGKVVSEGSGRKGMDGVEEARRREG